MYFFMSKTTSHLIAEVTARSWLHRIDAAECGRVPQRAANVAAKAQDGTLAPDEGSLACALTCSQVLWRYY
jgi:hypothetical protein